MKIAQAAFHILDIDPTAWPADWAWSLPLIVLTVVIHVLWLGLLGPRLIHVAGLIIERRYPTVAFAVAAGTTTLLATCLHGIEAIIWAGAYLFLGALPNFKSAILYSLNAMTSLVTPICHWKSTGSSWERWKR